MSTWLQVSSTTSASVRSYMTAPRVPEPPFRDRSQLAPAPQWAVRRIVHAEPRDRTLDHVDDDRAGLCLHFTGEDLVAAQRFEGELAFDEDDETGFASRATSDRALADGAPEHIRKLQHAVGVFGRGRVRAALASSGESGIMTSCVAGARD